MRYLVLLRGINVGGRNTVPMAELREAVRGLGCSDVATHANSGNLLCTSELDARALRRGLEGALAGRLGAAIACLALPAGRFLDELAGLPGWWGEPWARQYAMFFMPGADADGIAARVARYDLLEGERLHAGGLALYWGVRDRRDINRSALRRHIMAEPFYRSLTLRTSGTCARLAELLG
jgi:uncharacterized protein (DUF1697 family)